jgi:cathepsin L
MDNSPLDKPTIPNAVDWRSKGHIVTPVKNQGHCGSCWAFAATAALESHVAIQTGKSMILSVQELVSCVPNPHRCGGTGGCGGSTPELAYEYVSQNGMVDEWQFSYQSFHGAQVNCTLSPSSVSSENPALLRGSVHEFRGAVASIAGFSKLPTNRYHTLLSAVALLGPVVIAVAASHWGLYQGGIFDDDQYETRDIDHAVVLEGYGTDPETGQDFWLVRNSWGPNWGEDGYIRLKRVDPTTLDDPETDCKMDITPSHGIACTENDDGSDITPPSVQVCGTSGILYDGVVPIGGHLV